MAHAGSATGATREGAAWVRRLWWVVVLIGLAVFVLGIVMLCHVETTTTVLAVLVGIYLIIWGIANVSDAHRAKASWPGYVLAVVLIVGGLLVAIWPSASLHLLAVVIGITLIVAGIVRLASALTADGKAAGVDVAIGVISLIVGIIVVAWPSATVWVIGIVVGIRAIISGVELVIAGLAMRRALPTAAH